MYALNVIALIFFILPVADLKLLHLLVVYTIVEVVFLFVHIFEMFFSMFVFLICEQRPLALATVDFRRHANEFLL